MDWLERSNNKIENTNLIGMELCIMRKSLSNRLYFISGILWAIASILNFINNKMALGMFDVCITIVFIILAFCYKKNNI